MTMVLSVAALAAPLLFATGAAFADAPFPGLWSNVTLTGECRNIDKVEFGPTTFRHGTSTATSTDAATYEHLPDGKVLINYAHGSDKVQLAAEMKRDRLLMTTTGGSVCEYLPPAAAEAFFAEALEGEWNNGGDNALSFVFAADTLTITDRADPAVVIAMRRLSAENGDVVFGEMDLPKASPSDRSAFVESKKGMTWSFQVGADGTLDLMMAPATTHVTPRTTFRRGVNPHAEAAIKAASAKEAEMKATIASMMGAWSVSGQSLDVLGGVVRDGGTLTITEAGATYEVDVDGVTLSMSLSPDTSKTGPSNIAIYKVAKYSTGLEAQHAAELERIVTATWVFGMDGKTLRVESDKGADIVFVRKP